MRPWPRSPAVPQSHPFPGAPHVVIRLVFPGGVLAIATSYASIASIVASANFASYADGALVGQNGWQQYNPNSSRPLSGSGGRVSRTGGNTRDGLDAMLAFGLQMTQPPEGESILEFDIPVTVNSAGANPSYFAAPNTLNTTTTGGNIQNARMVAKD